MQKETSPNLVKVSEIKKGISTSHWTLVSLYKTSDYVITNLRLLENVICEHCFSLVPFLPSAESSGAARILWHLYPVIPVRNTATFCKLVASRHGFQTKLFGTLIFTITQSSVWLFFPPFSLFLRVYVQKTKYLCINEIKLLAKLKRISVNFSSHHTMSSSEQWCRSITVTKMLRRARGPLCFACSCYVVTTSLLKDRDCACVLMRVIY
jgi:hypothetical protein